MKIVVLGLSITSTWGNGHATTYRSLLRALSRRDHELIFLERDVPWYASQRDMAEPPFCRLNIYQSLAELKQDYLGQIQSADFIIVGSYVPEGVQVAEWVINNAQGPVAFYDIDTPVTLEKLEQGDYEYLTPDLIPRFDLYLSFTGGPILERLESEFHARMCRPLYCSADPEIYYPEPTEKLWDLGYLGTYSPDRHNSFERLLMSPAQQSVSAQFVVAGSQYPSEIFWPANVSRISHLPSSEHRRFYNQQRYTLNLTRAPMLQAGFSPSVRLFEAAACGTAVISDNWKGLENYLEPGVEILLASTAEEVIHLVGPESPYSSKAIGQAARNRFLKEHTPYHRAKELESYLHELGCKSAATA